VTFNLSICADLLRVEINIV